MQNYEDQQQQQYLQQQYYDEQMQQDDQYTLDNLIDKKVTRTSNLPVNDHLQKLEVMISELVNDLEDSKKTMQIMRGDMLNIGFLEAENNQGISQLIQDEAIRVSKHFKKEQDLQKNEHQDFINQIKQLREQRKDLSNKVGLVNHRITETESNVGFKQAYAIVQDDNDEIQRQLDQYEQYRQQYQE